MGRRNCALNITRLLLSNYIVTTQFTYMIHSVPKTYYIKTWNIKTNGTKQFTDIHEITEYKRRD
jgi:hypothetical protein